MPNAAVAHKDNGGGQEGDGEPASGPDERGSDEGGQDGGRESDRNIFVTSLSNLHLVGVKKSI